MPGWLAAPDGQGRSRFRLWLVCSAVLHVSLLVLLGMSPRTPARQTELPAVVRVALVAPSQAPDQAPKPAPSQAAPRPRPKPPPAPEKVALPEKPKPVPEPEPAPAKPPPEKPAAKPKPKRKPPPKPPPVRDPAPESEGDYDDVLAALREQAGERAPQPTEVASTEPPDALTGGVGVPISAEEAAWRRRAKVRVHRSWILAPGFRMQPLETEVRVKIGPAGDVSDLRVTRSSGNPWFDESVERAIKKASPFPRPPESGTWTFVFRPEDLL